MEERTRLSSLPWKTLLLGWRDICLAIPKAANYNLLMKRRDKNKITNLGKIYLDKTKIITGNKTKAKVTWLIK